MAGKVAMVALLRGINVGKAKRVAMADLRMMVTDLGYDDVVTLLNSGNVVFRGTGTATTAAKRIADGLAQSLGVTANVTVITGKELAAVVRENPLAAVATDPSRLLVAFCARRADLGHYRTLAAQDWTPDTLAVGPHAAYMWCAGGILASRLAETALRTLGDRVTTRNWATVMKLHALVAPAG
jgi:uncharacterized protein (DUF1697 family)